VVDAECRPLWDIAEIYCLHDVFALVLVALSVDVAGCTVDLQIHERIPSELVVLLAGHVLSIHADQTLEVGVIVKSVQFFSFLCVALVVDLDQLVEVGLIVQNLLVFVDLLELVLHPR
jgi:hypothetical protein